MIEMLGVLAVIGVLSAGGIWGYTLAMENYRYNTFLSDLEDMYGAAQGIFRANKFSSESEINIYANVLCNLKIIPEKYCKTLTPSCQTNPKVDSCYVRSPWKTYERIFIYKSGKTLAFRVDILSSKRETCIKILSNINWKRPFRIGLYHSGKWQLWTTTKVSQEQAENTCNQGEKNILAIFSHLL